MELEFRPGKFALNRNTLETVIVKEVKEEEIQIINMFGVDEKWVNKKDYNIFKRKDGKWTVEGPPIHISDSKLKEMESKDKNINISERFK